MTWIDTILQGRVVRMFLGVVALYLGYQIWLNTQFYGTHWRCWDYMLISGFLAFILAIWLAHDIGRRLDVAIDKLRLNNALIVTEDGVAQLKQEMSERGKRLQAWSAVFIGLLIFGCYVWVFGDFAYKIWLAWQQGLLPQGGVALIQLSVFTALSALCAALAGLFFGRLAHYGTLAGVLSTDRAGLRIAPGHFDGASGLKPIGDFYLYQAVLFAIPILWLGAWWAWIIPTYKDVICSVTGEPQFLFREWQGPFFIMWLVVLAYFHMGFVRPFLTLRKRIRNTRLTLNRDEAQRLEKDIFKLQERAVSGGGTTGDALATEIEALSRRLWSIRNMWDWPMDTLTLTKYRSLVFGEVLLPVAAAVVSSSEVGSGGPFAVQWLQTLLFGVR
jgi:hypothetical protein